MEVIDWIWNHREELLAAAGTVWLSVLTILKALLAVAHLTDTLEDDKKIMKAIRFVESLALLRIAKRDRNDDRGSGIGGVPMICLAVCVGALVSGCAGRGPDAREPRSDMADVFIAGFVDLYQRGAQEFVIPVYVAKDAECSAATPGDANAIDACMASADRQMQSLMGAWGVLQAARYGNEASGGRAQAIACLPWAVDQFATAIEGLAFIGATDPPAWVEQAIQVSRLGVRAFVNGSCELEQP